MKGLVLSGGHGTRLRPLTHIRQKQLLPVANKPIIYYVIEDIVEAGINDIGVIVGPNREQVMETVGDGSRWGVKIEYIYQSSPAGLAHAVKISQDYLGDDDFVMYLGDNILSSGISKYTEEFQRDRCDAQILLTPVPNPSQFGVAEVDDARNVVRLEEKPREPKSNLALIGIYFFSSPIFEAVNAIKLSWRNELEITDAIQYLLDHNLNVRAVFVEGWWKDTGKTEDILDANRLVLDTIEPRMEGTCNANSKIQGKVSIGQGSVVKDGSVVSGPSIIGKNCVIGPHSFIGPYTSIGDGCTIKNSEIEQSILMGNNNIESRHRIYDSIIGFDTSIKKMGSVPKGVRFIIGENSEIEY